MKEKVKAEFTIVNCLGQKVRVLPLFPL